MSRRFKPLYPSLPLTGPLMRVLGAILEVFVLPMFDPRQKLLLGGAVAFNLSVTITRCTQLSACDAIPALMALLVASLRLLDYCAHSDLLVPLFACGYTMAKDGEVACWFQPFVVSSYGLSGAVSESKWPTR